MELRQVKANIVAADELLQHAADEMIARVNKKHSRIAEEDLKTLRTLILPLICHMETIDDMLGRYGRNEFGANVFAPKEKITQK